MLIADCQREVRTVYRGGALGQLVSGLIWCASAAAAGWRGPTAAMVVLVVGGFFIFPLTTLGLRLLGGPWKLPAGNPLNGLAMQVAFVLPLCLPLVLAAAHHRQEWFYPAMMVLLGAHYLPFIFLYGMKMFGVLAGLLIVLGLGLAHLPALPFAAPGWITGGVLLVFAGIGEKTHREAGR